MLKKLFRIKTLYVCTIVSIQLILFFSTGTKHQVDSSSPTNWIDSLPQDVQDSIYWIGDVEEGSLYDWEYPDFLYSGGGVYNTGGDDVEAVASAEIVHSGQYSARATITNVIRSQNGSRAVRLMRWTEKPWDDGGDFFPDESYYSTWMYVPYTYNPNKYDPWDPGDGGWWNIFQFKTHDEYGGSKPIWTLNVTYDDDTGEMKFYFYTKYNSPHSHSPLIHAPIPVGEWVHLEAYYKGGAANDGHISLWMNGELLFDIGNVQTLLVDGEDGYPIWGIGNYTDHIAGGPEEGTATLYFDDAVVSSQRVYQSLDAEFSVTPKEGDAPLVVLFQDQSMGDPSGFSWDFGDGTVSSDQNPIYTYLEPGVYTVSLTVSNGWETSTETKGSYIKVTSRYDLSGDDVVSTDDVIELIPYLHTIPVFLTADFNEDGVVNSFEYALLAAQV